MKQLAIDAFLPQEDTKMWMSLSLSLKSQKLTWSNKGQKGHSLTNFKLNHQGALVVGWPGFLSWIYKNSFFHCLKTIVSAKKKENKPVFLNQLQVRQKWARWTVLPGTKKDWHFIYTLCLFFLLFVEFVATLRHHCHLVSELQNSEKVSLLSFWKFQVVLVVLWVSGVSDFDIHNLVSSCGKNTTIATCFSKLRRLEVSQRSSPLSAVGEKKRSRSVCNVNGFGLDNTHWKRGL